MQSLIRRLFVASVHPRKLPYIQYMESEEQRLKRLIHQYFGIQQSQDKLPKMIREPTQ